MTPVSGSTPVVPEKMITHCATSSVARPVASSMRSGVRFQAATHSPCPAMAASIRM